MEGTPTKMERGCPSKIFRKGSPKKYHKWLGVAAISFDERQ